MKNWYVVHTQTGLEDKVKAVLEKKIISNSLQELIFKIVIPTEQISEVRSGKRRVSERRFFPGYVMVEMEMDDKTYSFIKSIPGVTGFIGSGRKPTPLPPREVENILKRTEETKAKPSPRIIFEKGEQVRVKEGPFMNFNGSIEEIHPEKGKLKVSISIFGRSTPVELEYWQVEKI
ncbi:MAG: transcription termination/antitermination protein NusG [Candidatus Omnitrophota bacterium]|nr:transcription termination/antitermination protein NusG [Candidatus Omnitrophota bacterium]MBU1928726.1 transcription termination/antitermination protein NusG [Candidatus Omnitrophota bacterium]MBU2034181.1 transcription termination/antitermination protein NusG [Candidatus Omnitrophota bacterium]MBU2221045.1 transcription termination/antitermination protein NusG [Candidatus Omnitrophota bacterium]MBU2258469.1 transcription termination/antitermination protein NusG [Candidatus Omnitrophota bact